MVAIAAAAVGRLTSLPLALVGGLGLGIFISLFDTFLPQWSDDYSFLEPIQDNLTPAIPFVVLFGVLVLSPGIGRAREATDPLSGVDPPPPSLAAESPVAGAHPCHARCSRSCSSLIVGIVVFTRADAEWMFLVTQAVILSTIFLSITVITGMAGQISLCQGAFAAIGGFTVFQLADRYDLSVLVGRARRRVHRRRRRGAAVAPGAAARRDLGGHRHARLRLLLRRGHGEVLVGRWRRHVAAAGHPGAPSGASGRGTSPTTKRSSCSRSIVLVIVVAGGHPDPAGHVGQTLQALRGSELAAQSIGISRRPSPAGRLRHLRRSSPDSAAPC